MKQPLLGLSLMPDQDFLIATMPLFEGDLVEILEWSPDIGWSNPPLPEWTRSLLNHYSENNRLLGHGVNFSPLTVDWADRDNAWLKNLQTELSERKFVQFSEHFGFARSVEYASGPPLPVPYNVAAVLAGRRKLERLAEIVNVPIGLENLALAFGEADVRAQGQFLEDLLAPLNGFMILDLHNLFCQIVNYNLDASALLDSYPLERVREIHISGGSWSTPSAPCSAKPIRRDTHNGDVPSEVIDLLPMALKRCPNVEAVILERLGGTMLEEGEQQRFREDYGRLKHVIDGLFNDQPLGIDSHSQEPIKRAVHAELNVVSSACGDLIDMGAQRGAWASHPTVISGTTADLSLYQTRLMQLLSSEANPESLVALLRLSLPSDNFNEYISSFKPQMIEVGHELVSKWASRSD